MTKPIDTQPGSPNFDGAEAYELYQSDMERAYARIRELENWWDNFANDYPHTANVLTKWLEERHGD